MPKLTLDRATLAKLLQGNQLAIVTFERILKDVGEALPGSIEEANVLAGTALAVAQANGAILGMLLDALEQLGSAPATQRAVESDDLAPAHALPGEPDDTAPRPHLGTISSQNADQVDITGGSINNVSIGATTPSTARVTTLQTDQLHTAAKGTKFSGPATLADAVVSTFSYEHPYTRYYIGDGTGYSFRFAKRTGGATTDVATITDQGAASFAGGFGCNGKPAQNSAVLGAAATDPATTQTLVNNIRAALIANGIGA